MIDLDPRIQTFLTMALLVVLVGLVVAHEIGRSLIRRDRASAWGARLILIGVGLRAFRRSPASALLPPPVRAILVSITESEPPSDPDRTPVGKGQP
jgi:hypothetical protein